MQAKLFPISLEESYMISPKVKHFIFSCELSPPFNYTPGQFITIHFEHQGKTLKRSYSIANAPQHTNRIEFAASYFAGGPGTELLYNLKQGEVIHINGPFGRLICKEQLPGRYILVATSTGITPYRAMIPQLKEFLDKEPRLQVVILQGVAHREDILYSNDFLALVQEYPAQVLFKPCLSKEPIENLEDHEFLGYVQQSFPELRLNPEQDLVYLCGNPGMIDEALNYLKEHGFAMPSIVREKYISA